MRVLQSPAMLRNTRRLTRNEQVSGSSPLVGSPEILWFAGKALYDNHPLRECLRPGSEDGLRRRWAGHAVASQEQVESREDDEATEQGRQPQPLGEDQPRQQRGDHRLGEYGAGDDRSSNVLQRPVQKPCGLEAAAPAL
jgi:hypothetical protein